MQAHDYRRWLAGCSSLTAGISAFLLLCRLKHDYGQADWYVRGLPDWWTAKEKSLARPVIGVDWRWS